MGPDARAVLDEARAFGEVEGEGSLSPLICHSCESPAQNKVLHGFYPNTKLRFV